VLACQCFGCAVLFPLVRESLLATNPRGVLPHTASQGSVFDDATIARSFRLAFAEQPSAKNQQVNTLLDRFSRQAYGSRAKEKTAVFSTFGQVSVRSTQNLLRRSDGHGSENGDQRFRANRAACVSSDVRKGGPVSGTGD
jgi:hypothetical protein